MRPDRFLVHDILDAIVEVIATTPPTREQFDADKFVRSHLIRNIQIIGEATWRLSAALKAQHPQVPWKLISGMRHAIVHDYFDIDFNEVYNTCIRDVPSLKPHIEAILAALGPDVDSGAAG